MGDRRPIVPSASPSDYPGSASVGRAASESYTIEHPAAAQHALQLQQRDMKHSHGPQEPYSMSVMANALPQASATMYTSGQPPRQQRINPATLSSSNMTSLLHVPQYTDPMNQYYLPQHAAQMSHFYPGHMSHAQAHAHAQAQAHAQTNMRAGIAYYPDSMLMNQQPPYYYPPTHYPTQTHVQPQFARGQYMPQQLDYGQQQQGHGSVYGPADQAYHEQTGSRNQAAGPVVGQPAMVRGPPRKPKQSGHAIWIGNLPPQTDLMRLVHHVCEEARGLQSLFLISKSNCAFANFRDEQTCTVAQQKLHDSKFQSVRLVSRLRKSTVEGAAGVTAPTGPAAIATSQAAPATDSPTRDADNGDETKAAGATGPLHAPMSWSDKDRYFILKSLTVEDLELSVRTNLWATQSHNEEMLNKAFRSVERVYLIFSANKSGEYFGYARMVSAIDENPAAAIEFAPKMQSPTDVDLPKAIATEATEYAPRGRIIDDSARGTIFWEAERDEPACEAGTGIGTDEDIGSGDGGGSAGGDSGSTRSEQQHDLGGGEPRAWGKPFGLEWKSTARLPFYRTRGLRNPWNSNREVKIARDGTELEPGVGRKLTALFHRLQSSAAPPVPTMPAAAAGLRVAMPMSADYPALRPAY